MATPAVTASNVTPSGVRWTFEAGEWAAPPVAVDGTTYVVTSSGTERSRTQTIHALDTATGTERWTYERPSDGRISDAVPAVTHQGIYFTSTTAGRTEPDHLVGLTPDGELAGTLEYRNIHGQPLVVDDMGFLATDDGVVAVDLSEWVVRWKSSADSLMGWLSGSDEAIAYPALSDGTLFGVVADASDGESYRLVALDAHTGTRSWETTRIDGDGYLPRNVTVAGDVVFLSGSDALYAFDSGSGETVWTEPITANTGRATGLHPIATAGGIALTKGTTDNGYTAIDISDGTPLWSHRRTTESRPLIAGSNVYGLAAPSSTELRLTVSDLRSGSTQTDVRFPISGVDELTVAAAVVADNTLLVATGVEKSGETKPTGRLYAV